MVPAPLKSPDGGSALDEIYRGTGLAKRSVGRPKGEFIQLKRPTIRKRAPKPSFEIVLDLGKKLGLCRRCTCPVHEADITDGYAEACDNGEWECIQAKFEDTCREYAMNHPAAVAMHATLPHTTGKAGDHAADEQQRGGDATVGDESLPAAAEAAALPNPVCA